MMLHKICALILSIAVPLSFVTVPANAQGMPQDQDIDTMQGMMPQNMPPQPLTSPAAPDSGTTVIILIIGDSANTSPQTPPMYLPPSSPGSEIAQPLPMDPMDMETLGQQPQQPPGNDIRYLDFPPKPESFGVEGIPSSAPPVSPMDFQEPLPPLLQSVPPVSVLEAPPVIKTTPKAKVLTKKKITVKKITAKKTTTKACVCPKI